MKPDRIAGPFEKFRAANPHVERRLIELLEEYERDGVTHVSIKHLWEVMRRAVWLQTKGELWKLNNSYTARYARVIRERRPDLAHLFSMRRLAGELTPEEQELARRQTDAFPETVPTPVPQPAPAVLQRHSGARQTRTATRGATHRGREPREPVVGESFTCDYVECGQEFVVRRRGQRFHHRNCRTAQWMIDHPRLL